MLLLVRALPISTYLNLKTYLLRITSISSESRYSRISPYSSSVGIMKNNNLKKNSNQGNYFDDEIDNTGKSKYFLNFLIVIPYVIQK
jgi:hypothetical protein